MATSTRKLALAAGIAAAGIVSGLPASAQGTTEQRQACMSDAMSLCPSDIPHADRIAACLRREQARVSPACLHEINGSASAVSSKE